MQDKTQNINWFPGHMAKAQRQIEERLKLVDIVLELIDARIPFSSINPSFEKMLKNKKKIIIITKIDLADNYELNKAIDYYKEKGETVLPIDSAHNVNISKINNLCKDVLKEKREKDKAKGLKERPIRIMILGIPNVGKSTLINRLCKKNVVEAKNTPGVTKSEQWVKINKDLELLDTPGVLWPKFDSVQTSFNLALTGAIKDSIVKKDDMMLYFLEYLHKRYKSSLSYYLLSEDDFDKLVLDNDMRYANPYVNVLDELAKRKTFIRDERIDYERVYNMLLSDFRNGNLGLISLDNLGANDEE